MGKNQLIKIQKWNFVLFLNKVNKLEPYYEYYLKNLIYFLSILFFTIYPF